MRYSIYLLFFAALYFGACTNSQSTQSNESTDTKKPPSKDYIGVSYSEDCPVVDGNPTDSCWSMTPWHPIDQRWLGEPFTKEDFSGRYKLLWSEEFLYVLAEIQDDTLIDIYENDLKQYWDDDCLEIFVDEDRSKGYHQYDHNAFAYHISLENKVIDIGLDSIAHYYPSHAYSRRTQEGKTSYWEVAMRLFDDTYIEGEDASKAVKLLKGKRIGFAIAYCDNDYSEQRENFIGSVVVEGEDKNRGWIDAGIFGEIRLE